MRNCLVYEIYLTSKFGKSIKKMDAHTKQRIEKSINDLSNDPYRKSEYLRGKLKGRRKHRMGDLRIVFAICEECRELGHHTINNCIDCDDLPKNGLKIFDIGLRGAIYK